jgi:hypothetical protein
MQDDRPWEPEAAQLTFSCGNCTFGITGDFTANPDLAVLAQGIEHGVSELLVAAKRHGRRAATKRQPAATRQ